MTIITLESRLNNAYKLISCNEKLGAARLARIDDQNQ